MKSIYFWADTGGIVAVVDPASGNTWPLITNEPRYAGIMRKFAELHAQTTGKTATLYYCNKGEILDEVKP